MADIMENLLFKHFTALIKRHFTSYAYNFLRELVRIPNTTTKFLLMKNV